MNPDVVEALAREICAAEGREIGAAPCLRVCSMCRLEAETAVKFLTTHGFRDCNHPPVFDGPRGNYEPHARGEVDLWIAPLN